MKTTIQLYALFNVVILILISLVSCKKENPNDNIKSFRIIEYDWFYENEWKYKEKYTYEADKIIAIHSQGLYGAGLIEFEYPSSNQVIQYWYNQENDTWILSFKTESIYNGNALIEQIGYDYDNEVNNWEMDYKMIRSYQSDKPKLIQVFHYVSGNWEERYRETAEYDGNLLVERIIFYYDDGVIKPDYKDNIIYKSDRIDTLKSYYFDNEIWHIEAKGHFNYSGNNLASIDITYYENGNFIGNGFVYYTYDDNGNLTSTYNLFSEGDIREIKYKYEEGRGNYRQIIGLDEDMDWVFNLIFPTPTKAKINPGQQMDYSPARWR